MPIHFDNIAHSYDEQLARHIREFLLIKKTRLTVKTLKKYGISKGRGIDLGCGTGWYLKNISEYGYEMTGIDSSELLVGEAKKNNRNNRVLIKEGNILELEFSDNSFDFAYCINSLHHLRNYGEIDKAFSESHRILKKGGLFIIHELNTFFLFRIYLNYIFPLTNKIDRFGGESWLEPKALLKQNLFEVRELYYYTFFPHIIPKSLFRLFCKINNFMEKVSLRRFGVHYMAVLIK
jgi:ubiquinone/menaquinone biosynthesis C-methylase UbiE